jgi:hypothetical protein
MKKRIQFNSTEERTNLINENSTLILIMDEDITEGKFLTFTDIKPIENQVADITAKQVSTENLVMAVMSGVFDLYMK